MKLTVFNGTDEHLSFSQQSRSSSKSLPDTPLVGESDLAIPPHASATTTVSRTSLTFRVNSLVMEKGKTGSAAVMSGLQAALPLKLGAKWNSVRASSDIPWRIYSSKISKGHYKLSVFPQRNLASFLSGMPDSLPLSSLLLPGTHDTCVQRRPLTGQVSQLNDW
ncbi:hypothetical protein LXA43DRAFT_229867 [Ganoderma leucocontextum]|nr:hypothetical protein LXA43DRAFT_229867 [Ganoderma leucocontextum]